MKRLQDALGRPLTDLRISVTDRCNFRCGYCMPRAEFDSASYLPRAELLSFEELRHVARLFVERGVSKLRLTGGEPLLRKDLPVLVSSLAPLGAEIALTTNGVLLARSAKELRRAGLSRVTVSLDALDEAVFQQACDAPTHRVADVLGGIAAALEVGLSVKVNCVVQRGINETQIRPLFAHFRHLPVQLRFIEFMDVGTRNDWTPERVVSREEILARLAAEGDVAAVGRPRAQDVAELYSVDGVQIGIIASVSQPFCGDCSRARLSSEGRLFTCLFAREGVDLRTPLRHGDVGAVARLVERTWSSRSDRYSELRASSEPPACDSSARRLPLLTSRVEMSYIGG